MNKSKKRGVSPSWKTPLKRSTAPSSQAVVYQYFFIVSSPSSLTLFISARVAPYAVRVLDIDQQGPSAYRTRSRQPVFHSTPLFPEIEAGSIVVTSSGVPAVVCRRLVTAVGPIEQGAMPRVLEHRHVAIRISYRRVMAPYARRPRSYPAAHVAPPRTRGRSCKSSGDEVYEECRTCHRRRLHQHVLQGLDHGFTSSVSSTQALACIAGIPERCRR